MSCDLLKTHSTESTQGKQKASRLAFPNRAEMAPIFELFILGVDFQYLG